MDRIEKLHRLPRLFRAFKRLVDLMVSVVMLLVLSPLVLLVSLLVFLDDGFPVFFRQQRVGRHGHPFTIFKFRTMKKQTPNCATAALDDPGRYITRIGRILRKTSLDEIPQLFNIITGHMSIVGPRPLIPAEKLIHELRVSRGVYVVRPGITGLAQVNGRDLVTDHEKARYDEEYVRAFSAAQDLRILLRTVLIVLKAEGIQEGRQHKVV